MVRSFDKADRAYEKKEYDEAAKLYYVVARECDCLSARLAWGVALVHVSELRRAEEAFDTGLTLALKAKAQSFIIAFGLNGAQVKSDLGKMREAAKTLESSYGNVFGTRGSGFAGSNLPPAGHVELSVRKIW